MRRSREQGLQRMLDDIRAEVAYTRRMTGRETLDPRVMAALGRVPRDAFVPEDRKDQAYDNGPLPIGHGQTISQPFIVALMTDLLGLQPDHRVLEIGTGSGYQTAVLAELCAAVYSMDRVQALADAAAARLAALGYANAYIRCGDGYAGWPEHAPYDAVIVTAAAPRVPEALTAQLKPGGRLVIPVGRPYMPQELRLLTRDPQGGILDHAVLGVVFVPLVERQAED